MKNLILLFFLIYLSSIKASINIGVYSCPITFPTGAFEVLQLDFKNQIINPVYLLNASQTTPNFMFIKDINENEQQSIILSQATEETKETYQIHWKDTWYFGSTLRVYIKSNFNHGFIADIEFDDNDGLAETLESTCLLQKFSEVERPATFE